MVRLFKIIWGVDRQFFYAVVKSETAMMKLIISSFKHMDDDDDTSKTCTEMLDKDENDIDAVQNILPNADLLAVVFMFLNISRKKFLN